MKKLNYVLILLTISVFFVGFLFFRLDDAYIFYTYARNIADGNGYVFNLGEKVNATTSPLYTLLLALVYFIIKPVFPDSLVYIGSVISIGSIAFILFLMRKIINNEDKFLFFALIFFSMPVLKFGFGMETYLNLALIILTIYLFSQNKLNLASLTAGLTVLARLDSILFVGVLFLYYIITKKRILTISSIIIFIFIVAPWFIFSKIYFDSFLPTTIGLKLTQSNLGIFGDGLIFLTGSIRLIPGHHFTISLVIVLLIVSIIFFRINKIRFFLNHAITILTTWSVSLFVAYAFILNAPPYVWYYIPFTLILSLVFAAFLAQLTQRGYLQIVVIGILLITSLILPIKNTIEGYNPKYNNFIEVTSWLNQNATEGASIAADDVGILGYHYKKGKMLDALGLITPAVIEHLAMKDFNWFLNHYKPEYVVHEYPELQTHLRGDQKNFWENYEAVKVFDSRGEKIAIYKRKASQNL